MTDIQTWLDQGRTLADQAADHVGRLAAGDDKWTMTVPPKDTDSDMALMSLLDGRLRKHSTPSKPSSICIMTTATDGATNVQTDSKPATPTRLSSPATPARPLRRSRP